MVLLSPAVAKFLCHVLAFVYPAYASFKAARTSDAAAHASWLTFWIAQSYFLVFELVGDVLLSGWIPLYWELKVALLVWLVMPRFRGAERIYTEVIHPYLLKYETDIDRSIEAGSQQIGEMGVRIADAGAQHLRKGSNEFLKLGQQAVLSGLLAAAATPPALSQPANRPRGASVSTTTVVIEEERDS